MNKKDCTTQKWLLVDDEQQWIDVLSVLLKSNLGAPFDVVSNLEQAVQRVENEDYMSRLIGAIVDVKLRPQKYDQSGLAILDLLKEKRSDIPVLMLTAYAEDYPGIRKIVSRYVNVLVYDKATFQQSPSDILSHLVPDLPPQIGDQTGQQSPSTVATQQTGIPKNGRAKPLVHFVVGAFLIGLILGSTYCTFLIFEKFTGFQTYLKIVFTLVVLTLLSVLVGVFGPSIVGQALQIYNRAFRGRDADTNRSTRLSSSAKVSGESDTDIPTKRN